MTVKELIERLHKFDRDTLVCMRDGEYGDQEIDTVCLVEGDDGWSWPKVAKPMTPYVLFDRRGEAAKLD